MQVYTVSEIAKLLKVKKGFVYELIRQGELEAIKLSQRRYRITEKQLEEFIKKHSKNKVASI